METLGDGTFEIKDNQLVLRMPLNRAAHISSTGKTMLLGTMSGKVSETSKGAAVRATLSVYYKNPDYVKK